MQAIEGLSQLRDSPLAKETLTHIAADDPATMLRERAALALTALNSDQALTLKNHDEEVLLRLRNKKGAINE